MDLDRRTQGPKLHQPTPRGKRLGRTWSKINARLIGVYIFFDKLIIVPILPFLPIVLHVMGHARPVFNMVPSRNISVVNVKIAPLDNVTSALPPSTPGRTDSQVGSHDDTIGSLVMLSVVSEFRI
jgi:hypothetical protein